MLSQTSELFLQRPLRQQQLFLGVTRTPRLFLKLIIYLPICLLELERYSRTRKKYPTPCNKMLSQTSELSLQKPCDKLGSRQIWIAWWSPYHGKEAEAQVAWPHLKIIDHDEDDSAGKSGSLNKKERKTEEMGRQQEWGSESPWEQRKTENGRMV